MQSVNAFLQAFQIVPNVLGLLQVIGQVNIGGIGDEELFFLGNQLPDDIFVGLHYLPKVDDISFDYQNLFDHPFFIAFKNDFLHVLDIQADMVQDGLQVKLQLVQDFRQQKSRAVVQILFPVSIVHLALLKEVGQGSEFAVGNGDQIVRADEEIHF